MKFVVEPVWMLVAAGLVVATSIGFVHGIRAWRKRQAEARKRQERIDHLTRQLADQCHHRTPDSAKRSAFVITLLAMHGCRIVANGFYLKNGLLARVNLSHAQLVGAWLVDAELPYSELVEANLRGANLKRANFLQANLRGANLVEANLEAANLVEANLEGANLHRAFLRRADLTRAKRSQDDLAIPGWTLTADGLRKT
ncbi:MAG: pentapeptide repeat-containing protein [Myxococcota bacterium]